MNYSKEKKTLKILWKNLKILVQPLLIFISKLKKLIVVVIYKKNFNEI